MKGKAPRLNEGPVRKLNISLLAAYILQTLISCNGSGTSSEATATGGTPASGGATVVANANGGSTHSSMSVIPVGGASLVQSTTGVFALGGNAGLGAGGTLSAATTTALPAGGSTNSGGTRTSGGSAATGTSGGGHGGISGTSGGGIGGSSKGVGGAPVAGASSGGASSGGASSGGAPSGGASTAACTTSFKFKTPFMDGTIYTADPSARVFGGKVYVYPSHDLATNPPEDAQAHHFNMADYHVYSTDLACWPVTDHGEVLNIKNVAWAKEQMWAPDAAYKNGKYYFYFPARAKADNNFHIGVAVGPSPTGPFTAEPNYIANSSTIDPVVLVDDDGAAYMYFGGKQAGQLPDSATGPRMAKMSDDMLSFSGPVTDLKISGANGTNSNFFEGTWVHKYKGTYYLSYSTGPSHILAYATGASPTGPFTYKGTLLNAVTSGWTTHHSVIEYGGKWYLFYADSTCSSGVTQRRCVKVQELKYNSDGSIPALNP